MNPEWVTVGQIVGVHGIRGALKVRLLSDFPERLTTPGSRWLQRLGQPLTEMQLQKGQAQPHKNLYIVSLAECQDRTTAETWVGATIVVPATVRPTLAADEYYLSDLVGLTVYQAGDPLGRVVRVINSPAQDLLEIQVGERRLLLPFVRALVPVVDLAQQRLEITPPLGWLESS